MKPTRRLIARPLTVLAALLAAVPFAGTAAAGFDIPFVRVPSVDVDLIYDHLATPNLSLGGCQGVNQDIVVEGPVTLLLQSALNYGNSGPAADSFKGDYGLFLYHRHEGSSYFYTMYGSSSTATCAKLLVDHVVDTASCAATTAPDQWVQWAASIMPSPNVPGVDGEPVVQQPPCEIHWTP